MLPFDDLLPALLDALWSLSALVIGLVALTGLLLQRARALEVVVGTLRAELGVAALASGTALTLWGLEEMSTLLLGAFGIDAAGATGSGLRGILPDSRASLTHASTISPSALICRRDITFSRQNALYSSSISPYHAHFVRASCHCLSSGLSSSTCPKIM